MCTKRARFRAVDLGAAFLLAWTPVDLPATRSIRPNVLVIVLDDTGAEKLALYAPPVPTPPTPRLSELAGAGVRFTNAYANPVCNPTRATIISGRYAFRTGNHLSDGEITLAELLRDGFPGEASAYRRAAFGKWHVAPPADRMHAIRQGFERFVGLEANVSDHFDWDLVTADAGGDVTTRIGGPNGPFDESTFTASVVRRAASAWIDATATPFFAYVGFNAPHAPFQVPPLSTVSATTASAITTLGFEPGDDLFGTADARAAYDWLIESVDTEIGRLIDDMPPAKRANTTILIVGDNGTPATVIQAPPYESTHAKGRVYQQGTLVPLIAAGHGVDARGTACDGLVSTVDLWRTVADICGAQLSAGHATDGVSFLGMLRDPSTASARSSVFVQLYDPGAPYVPLPDDPPPGITRNERGLSDGRFKYVRRWTTLPGHPSVVAPIPVEEAYDLSIDPLEKTNLWPTLSTLPAASQVRIRYLKRSMIALSGF